MSSATSPPSSFPRGVSRGGARHALHVAILVAVVLLAYHPVDAQAPDDLLTPVERAWLIAHGPIVYAPDPSYPPFEFVGDDNIVTGINIDFLNRMSRNLQFEYEVAVLDNWTAVLDAMRAGDVDLLGAIARNPEREVYMDFVGPYMRVGEVFYVREGGPAYTGVTDLVGARVGVIEDYAAAAWLATNHPELTLVRYPDMARGLNALSVGEIDAFFENVPVGAYVIRQNALTNIRILGEPLYFSEANWAVPKGEAILQSIITKGMASIDLGEQTRVFEYWTGYDLGIRPSTVQTITPLARNALFAVGAVAILAGGWSLSLRRTVRLRTRALEKSNKKLAEDVERREAAERQVRHLNESLEARVARRTRELANANEELEAFTYTVSHDLRTPLTSLSAYAQVLEKRAEKTADDQTAKYASRMRVATKRMAQIIEDVLTLSQASRAPVQADSVDLSLIADEVATALRELDPTRVIDFRIQPAALAQADPRLMRLVLENLLGNAWKYTRNRPNAEIAFGFNDENGERVYFVTDNGAGFDPAEAHKLFKTFERLHADADFEGTGIGLSTVKRIISRHDGRVWGEGRVDEGATFRFTLGGA